MALRLVRQTSETPNITNKDDTIMTRYAYGGYNGVVKNFGNNCNYYSDNGIFRILSGRIVVDGWEIDVDGAGWSLDLSNVTNMQYHSVYAEINVSIESVEIKSTYLTGNYPEITKGDDLTATPNGTARLLLYQVWVQNGRIVSATRKFEYIPYLTQKVLDLEKGLNDFDLSLTGKAKPLYGYDEDKGTIEERLTALGFREGSVTLSSGTATTNKITRQGNYCILNLNVSFDYKSLAGLTNIGTLEFFPNSINGSLDIICTCSGKRIGYGSDMSFSNEGCSLQINTNGVIKVTKLPPDNGSYGVQINNLVLKNIGYEAEPITD